MQHFNFFRTFIVILINLTLFLSGLAAEDIGVLKVRGDRDYPPFEYLNEDGMPEGYNIDVFKAVADVMGIDYKIELGQWSEVRREIESGEADVLLGMYSSIERDKLVDFSIPHFVTTYAVFVKKGSELSSLEDISGKLIGAQKDDIGFDFLVENNITKKIKPQMTIHEVLEDLAAGLIDCAVISRLQGMIIIKNQEIKGIEPVGSPIIQREYCFAVTEGNRELLSILDEGLNIIKTSGEYDEIYEEWFGIYEQTDIHKIAKYIIFIIAPLMVIILIVVLWNWSLKKQVSVRTSELRKSREGYRTTLNSIGDAVITTDTDGRVTGLNPVAEELTGWKLAEAEGLQLKDIFSIVDAKTREPLENPVWQVLSTGKVVELNKNTILISREGLEYPVSDSAAPIRDDKDNIAGVVFVFRDITEEHHAREALHKRLIALSQPMDDIENIDFEIMFDINEIQKLQDDISRATGLSSAILSPDGENITKPSSLAPLCFKYFRTTDAGLSACLNSDKDIISGCEDGPYSKRCECAGLWDAGTRIVVAGRHIATWLIGQARDPSHTVEDIRACARELGSDEDKVAEEFLKLPIMTKEDFNEVLTAIDTIAVQLSDKAYQNIQLARLIKEKSESGEEMRILQNHLSNIIDSMPSMLIGIDSECRITQWNYTAVKESGLEESEVRGRLLTEVRPQLTEEIDTIKDSIRTSMNIKLRRKARYLDGKKLLENITIFPLKKDGFNGAVILIEDVSASVQMEEVMIQSEKMLSVGGLAAGMAHEINNPLAGIIQTASVLSHRLLSGPEIPSNLKAAEEAGATLSAINKYMELRGIPRMLDAINESGGRVAAIVANMLTFARKNETDRSTHSITEIVDKSIELARTDYNLKKDYDFKRINIILKYAENLPEIICESGQLQQVILNILRNGAQAMQHKTEEESEFSISIDEWTDGPGVCIQISDNGPGMDEETRHRVFEPFFTTKPVGLGTGLGLSVSYFIVTDNHNGEMSVESEPGRGAKFIIKLPTGRTLDG